MSENTVFRKQQIAFPEVAALRKGTPKVKGQNGFIQGSDLGQNFRLAFYPGTAEARALWQKNHPETYVKYDNTYRRPGQYAEPDGYEIARVRAMVPFRSVFDAWEWANEAHTAGRMVAKADDEHYLMLRDPLDGRYIVQNGEPYTEFHHGDQVRYEKAGRQMALPIRTVGRLRLFLPELERMVFITLKTTSYYDRLNIDAHLSAIQFLANTLNGGNAAGVPFYVYRREQEVTWNKPDGSAVRVKKWLVNIEADPDWVKVATSRMANFALTGAVNNALLMPPVSTPMQSAINPLDDPDEPDDEVVDISEADEVLFMSYEQAAAWKFQNKGQAYIIGQIGDPEKLRIIAENAASEQTREAARVVLKHDFNMAATTKDISSYVPDPKEAVNAEADDEDEFPF